MNARISDLAFRIADDAARADIEIMCRPVGNNSESVEAMRTCWYDVAHPFDPELAPCIAIAVEYLDGRGMLRRHPDNAEWLHVRDSAANR